MPVSRHPYLLRLGAAVAAAVTVLPALPAAADDDRPVLPPVRAVQLACPADRVTGISFTDAAGNVHNDAITCLNWYGIAQGGADGTYGAGRAVTRGQLATFLVRVLEEADIELASSPADAFRDDDGHSHERNLNALAALGIVHGAGDGTVSPDEPVQRDQMASFLVRIVALIDDEQLTEAVEDFFDDDDDNFHEDDINKSAGAGFTDGRNGNYEPRKSVFRDEMASFLSRALDLLVQEGTTPPKQ